MCGLDSTCHAVVTQAFLAAFSKLSTNEWRSLSSRSILWYNARTFRGLSRFITSRSYASQIEIESGIV